MTGTAESEIGMRKEVRCKIEGMKRSGNNCKRCAVDCAAVLNDLIKLRIPSPSQLIAPCSHASSPPYLLPNSYHLVPGSTLCPLCSPDLPYAQTPPQPPATFDALDLCKLIDLHEANIVTGAKLLLLFSWQTRDD